MNLLLFMDLPGSILKVDFWVIVVPVLLGLSAVYLLLPGVQSRSPFFTGGMGALALLLAGWLLIRGQVFHPETILFYCFAGIGISAGVALITQHNPVHAALSFALVILSTCGLFLLQAAPFLMAATTIVYAGAIIVTFVFVIMLAQQRGLSDADRRSREPFMSCLAGAVLLGALLFVLRTTYNGNDFNMAGEGIARPAAETLPAENVAALGQTLFTDYLLAVELGGTLLLVATIGAIAITARRTEELR
jgi:NADH-quinone oxidoreductase subunit J